MNRDPTPLASTTSARPPPRNPSLLRHKADRETDRKAGRQAGRQTQADRQADRQHSWQGDRSDSNPINFVFELRSALTTMTTTLLDDR